MTIKAYILAADPAWIESSVLSYYDVVDEIVLSYDRDRVGWTGKPIAVDECVDRVRAVDRDRKVRLLAGDYHGSTAHPMENDSRQRLDALAAASPGADWVLQVDTDEVLPDARALVDRLRDDVPPDYQGVDWPMRAIFNRLPDGRFLEVCTLLGRQQSEYPGCAAVRANSALASCRFPAGKRWRYDVRRIGIDPVTWRRYVVHGVVPPAAAIVHFSWARTEESIRKKVSGWSHSTDFDGPRYVDGTWLRARERWRWMYRFHPLDGWVWPALRAVRLPDSLTLGSRYGEMPPRPAVAAPGTG